MDFVTYRNERKQRPRTDIRNGTPKRIRLHDIFFQPPFFFFLFMIPALILPVVMCAAHIANHTGHQQPIHRYLQQPVYSNELASFLRSQPSPGPTTRSDQTRHTVLPPTNRLLQLHIHDHSRLIQHKRLIFLDPARRHNAPVLAWNRDDFPRLPAAEIQGLGLFLRQEARQRDVVQILGCAGRVLGFSDEREAVRAGGVGSVDAVFLAEGGEGG